MSLSHDELLASCQSNYEPYSSPWNRVKSHFDQALEALDQLAKMGHHMALGFVESFKPLNSAPAAPVETIEGQRSIYEMAGVKPVKSEAQISLGADGAVLVGQTPVDVQGRLFYEDNERMMTVGNLSTAEPQKE